MEDNVVRRGRGRPRVEGSFDRTFTFCGNDDHEYMRDTLTQELKKNGGEVLREALEMLHRFES